MSTPPDAPDPGRNPALNPALKSRRETTHDTASSAAPVETTSVQREEGRAWPVVWLVVTVLSVVVTLYLIFG